VTLSQLRVLLAVADHGGFTAAAEHVGMSQPAVSRAIGAIEGELKTPLFVRRKDGVALTEAGRLAAAHAREALRHFDLLHAEVAAAAGRLTGTLRLASLPSATGTLIAAQVSTFTNQHPHVQVRLFEGTDQEVRDWLSHGAAELGVVTLPAPGFETVPLGTDEMVAVVPIDHELAAHATVSFRALSTERFILATGGCGPLIMTAARKAGARLQVAFEAREPAAILAMVAEGLGVSVMPTLGLPPDRPGVITRPLQPRTPRTLALARGSRTDTTPAARAFLDQIATSDQAQPASRASQNVVTMRGAGRRSR
jgi:DNA-binding transcriptional LysR family regulator